MPARRLAARRFIPNVRITSEAVSTCRLASARFKTDWPLELRSTGRFTPHPSLLSICAMSAIRDSVHTRRRSRIRCRPPGPASCRLLCLMGRAHGRGSRLTSKQATAVARNDGEPACMRPISTLHPTARSLTPSRWTSGTRLGPRLPARCRSAWGAATPMPGPAPVPTPTPTPTPVPVPPPPTSANVTIDPNDTSPVVLDSHVTIAAISGDHMLVLGGRGDTVSLTGGNDGVMPFREGTPSRPGPATTRSGLPAREAGSTPGPARIGSRTAAAGTPWSCMPMAMTTCSAACCRPGGKLDLHAAFAGLCSRRRVSLFNFFTPAPATRVQPRAPAGRQRRTG